MFDLWKSTITLVTYNSGRITSDGIKLDKTSTSQTYNCWFTTGADQRLMLKDGGFERGQFRQGDATVLLQSPGVDFNSILNLDHRINAGGLTYQIIDVNTRPRGFVYLSLKKLEG